MAYEKNYYAILSLPSPSSSQPLPSTPSSWTQEVKKAYRRALLQHHPDKSSPLTTNPKTNNIRGNAHSIDDIKKAYFILSDPSRRSAYNQSLALRRLHPDTNPTTPDSGIDVSADTNNADEDFILGLEVVDLDDMIEDVEAGAWYRSCRCGAERGFVVEEGELEKVEGRGGREVLVGCLGCSLWVRVGFGVLEEGEERDGKG